MADDKEIPLSPAQRSRIRRLSQPVEIDPADGGGELNIIPFLDIITNVLMFVLATLPAVFTVTIETNPPAIGPGRTRPPDKPALDLTLLIVNEGVSLKASGGNIAPGCDNPGPGIAVPRRNGQYDWETLKICAKKLKEAAPEFAEETNVRIIPNYDVDYQTIVNAMDAVRDYDTGDPNKPGVLFPDVNFGVAK